MLVLSRSVGETIQIGPDIYVTVVKITPHSIRLGIEAPQHASIIRGELAPLQVNLDLDEVSDAHDVVRGSDS